MKSLRSKIAILSVAAIFSSLSLFAQPNWVATTPSTTEEALYAELFYGVDEDATIYGFLLGENYSTVLAPGTVEFYAGQPTNASRVSRFTIPISGGDVNTILSTVFYNQYTGGYLTPSKEYTFLLVAKNGSNQYSSVEYVHFTTPACPNIYIETGMVNADRCVNGDGATKTYAFNTKDGDLWPGEEAGILEGAEWSIDWGDGTGANVFHTSTTTNDGPGGVFVPGWERGTINYTYNNHDDCFYVATFNVSNPGACATIGSLSESKVAILHGRDLDDDGNGDFIVDEVGTGVVDTIYVCEGQEYTTSIEDISTWDCQPDIYYPGDLAGSPTGETNEETRVLQWIYGGASPDAAVEGPANTITGTVTIGGLGTVNSGGAGIYGDTVHSEDPILNISAPITIPATAQEDEMFKIYYKNWNKCNPFAGTEDNNSNYIETEIVILIIHAPDPPVAPDRDACFGAAIPNLTATASEGGVLNWYSDAALTTNVATGPTFAHGHTAVGTYTYYVAETAGGCEGAPKTVILTINPLPDETLAVSDDEICELEAASVIVSSVEAGTEYRLRSNPGNGLIDGPDTGAAGSDITFGFTPASTATYNVLATITATGCFAELTDNATVTVNPLADINDQPDDEEICEGEDISFEVGDDGSPAVTGHQWQVQTGGAGPWNNITNNVVYDGATTSELELSSVPAGYSGNRYKCILTTGGPCTIESGEAELTVNPLPLDRTVSADDPYMCYNGSTDIEIQTSQNGINYTLRIGTTNQSTQAGDGNNLDFAVGPLSADVTYNVLAVDPGSSCSRVLSDQPAIRINPEMNVNVTALSDVCEGNSVNLPSMQRSGGSGTNRDFDWSGTDGYSSTLRDPAPYTPAVTGNITYTGTFTDGGFLTESTGAGDPTTCSVSDAESLTVHPLPIDRTVTIDDTRLCYNTGTTVNVENSENTVTYEVWDNTLSTSYGSQVGDGGDLNFATGNLTADVTFRVIATSATTPACPFELGDHPSVQVNPLMSVTASVDDDEICAGTTITFGAAPSGGSGDYTYAWSGPAAFSSMMQNPSTVPNTEGLPHTYTVVITDDTFTPSAGGTCTANDDVDVTVYDNPTAAATVSDPTACTNVSIDLDGGSTQGSSANLTHLWSGDIAYIDDINIEEPDFSSPAVGIYNFTYTVSDDNGCSDSDMTSLTVSGPEPDILAAGVSTDHAGICDGVGLALDGNVSSIAPISSHLWTPDVGSPAAIVPATSETPTFTHGTAGLYTYFYQVQDNAGCIGYDTIEIEVSSVTAAPTALPNANPCAGQTINLNGTPSGGSGVYTTHTWTEVSTPVGGAGALSATNIQTPTFTGAVPGTYTYTYYVQDNATCDYTSGNFVITVKAVPDLTNGLVKTVCSGDNAGLALTISNGPLAPLSYSWTAPSYSDGSLSGGSAGSGTTLDDAIINDDLNASETATYSVTPTANGCVGIAENVVLTIKPEPVVSTGQVDVVCSGTAFDYEILLDNFGSGAGVTFTWPAPVVTGSITGGAARSGAPGTAANITDAFINKTGATQTATYTVTPYYNGCEGNPQTIILSVKPQPDITDDQNPEICSDVQTNYQILLENVSPATTSYSWALPALTGGISGGSARAGSTGNMTETFSNTTGGTETATFSITPTFDGCVGETEDVIFDVKPEPVITAGQSETVCSGIETSLDIALDNFTNPVDNVEFTWGDPTLSVTTPNFTWSGSARSTASRDPLEDTFTNKTGSQQTATYSVTPTYNGCDGDPINVIIYIDPEPVVDAGQTATACSDNAISYEITVANLANGLVSYTWAAPSESVAMPGGTARTPAATGNLNDTYTNITSATQTATYTVTPSFGGCTGADEDIIVSIKPEPVITPLQNPTTCSSSALDHVIAMDNFTNPGDVVTFTWLAPTLDVDPDFSGGAARAVGTVANLGDTYINTSNATFQSTYTITPVYDGCSGDAETIIVDVKPEPVITAGQSETVCSRTQSDLDIALENFTNPGDNITFTWAAPTLSTTTNFSGGTARAVASIDPIEDAFINQTGIQQTATYSVTPYYNGCAGTAVDVVVRVDPEPVVTPGQEPPVCSDVALNYQIAVSNVDPTAVSYTWGAPTNSGGMTGGSSRTALTGNITDVFNNVSSATQDASYTVTPVYGGCTGQNESIIVKVAPEPVMTAGQNPTTCSQTALNYYITLTNFASGDGVMYEWAAPTLDADPDFSGGLPRPGPAGGNLTDSYTNKSGTTLQSSYLITPSLAGCEGNQVALVVDVKPEPDITDAQEVTVCSGEALDYAVLFENFANPGDNVTMTWAAPTLTADPDFSGPVIGRAVGSSNNITDTYTNTSGVQQTATYYITPTYNGCEGTTEAVTVRVNPEPVMTSPTTETICSSSIPSIVFTSDIAADYNWEVTFVSATISGAAVGNTGSGNLSQTLVNAGAGIGTVIYRVTPTSDPDLCVGTAQNVTITVNPEATVVATNAAIMIAAGNPTPAGPTGLQVTLSNAAVQGAPAGWIVVDPFPGEGTFDDEYSLNPIFTPSANQETAGYVTVQYITNDPDGGAGPCIPDTAEVFINIGQLPSANAGVDTIMCFEPTIDLKGYIGGAATTGTWSRLGVGTGTMGASTLTDTVVRATYTFGPDEIGVDIITFRLETDDPDAGGPVPAAYDDKVVTVNPLPITSAISGHDSVCVNTESLVYSIDLTAGSTYTWNVPASVGSIDFGGTGLNSNMSIITAAAVAGEDDITVFESNQFGCTDGTVSKHVVVLDQSAPDPITGLTTVCAGQENVTYTVPAFPGSTYQWFVPVGAAITTDPTLNTITVNFDQFSGQVRAVETNPGGCITNHGPLMVTVNSLPIATLNAAPTEICPGTNVIYTAGPAAQTNYQFFLNGVEVQNGASETWSSTTIADTDEVTVIVTAGSCSTESSPVDILVYENPTVTLTADDESVCDGTPVAFTATSAAAVQYTFRVNGSPLQSSGTNLYTNSTLNDGDAVTVDVLSAFACPGTSNTINMTVFDLPTAVIDGDYTICPGTTVDIDVASAAAAPLSITIDNGIGTIDPYVSGTAIPVTPAFSATYSLTEITDGNGCTSVAGANITGTAEITLLDTARILVQPWDAEVCEGVDTSFTVGAFGTNLHYKWFQSAVFGGPYAEIPLSDVSTLDLVAPGAAIDGNYFYVEVISDCDSKNSDTVQIHITYSPITARDPFDQSICEGFPTGFGVDAGATQGATYQWYVREDGASPWQALLDTAFYSGSKTDSLMIASGRSYMNGMQYYVEITGDCSGSASSAAATLSVDESPEILDQPDDVVVCEAEVTSFSVDPGVTTNPDFEWQVDMRAGGGWETIGEDSAGVYSGYNTATLGVTTASRFNQYRYRVIVSGDCNPSITSSYATLTVNEIPEVLTAPVASTICEDQSTTFSVNAGVTTGVLYEWEVYDGSSWETIGSDTAIYNGHANSTLILSSVPSKYDGFEYRVTVSGTCAAPITPAAVALTINEQPEILAHPVDATVCDGDVTSFTVDPGVTDVPTYQWQVNKIGIWNNLTAADESPTTYTGVTAQTLQVNQPDLSYNGYRYRVILSGTCTPAVTSDFATLTIDTRPEISLQPDSITTCEDGNVQFMVIAGGTTEPEYAWEYSNDNGATWDDAATLPEVSDSELSTLDLVGIPSGYNDYLFRVWVSGKCTLPLESDHVLLTVWQKPEVDTDPLDVTSCEQDTVMFTVDAGLTTLPVYTWQYWNGAAWIACSGTIYEGTNNDTLYINGIYSSLNGTQYRALIGGACLPEMPSAAATLTVDERPEIILQPLDEEICEGDDVSFSITTGVTTAPVIRWEYFDGSWNAATGGIFSNEDQPTIDLTAVPSNWDGREFRAIVGNLCGPEDTSNVVTLTVNELPEIIGQPVESTTCEGIATLFGVDAGVTTNVSYQWEYDRGSGWEAVTGGEYSGANDDTLRIANPASYMHGYEFRVVVSGECTPAITSDEVFLYIEENPEITVQPIGDAICEGDNTAFTVNAGVTTDPTYEWFVDTGSGMVSLGVDAQHSGITNATLDISGALFSMDENEYQVVVSGKCGVPVNSDVIELIVYKAPEITVEPVDTTTCEGKNVSFSVETGDTDSPNVRWLENDGTSGWLPITDGGIYSGALTHTLQIFAVDSAMNGYEYRADISNLCGGPLESDEVTLYVENPAVIWDQPDDITICEASTADFEVVATGTNITYLWQVDMRDGNGYQDLQDTAVYMGSATAHLEVAVPATALASTSRYNGYRYRVVVTSADCTPARTSDYAELTVQELAEVVTAPVARVLCEDESTTFSVNAGVTTDPTYLWEVDNGSGWETIGADTAIYSGYNNSTLILSTIPSTYDGFMYRVTIGGPCASSETPVAVMLTVNERPQIDAGPVNDTVCENDPTSFTVDPGVTTVPTYQWQVNKFGAWANLTGADEGPTTYTGVTAQTLLVNQPDLSYNNYQYRVIVGGTCGPNATSEAAVLVIDTRPEVLIDPIDRTICEDDDLEFTVHAGGTTEPEYLWYYSTDDGSSWNDAAMLAEVLVSTDDTLSLSSVPSSLNGTWFRALITGKCPPAGAPVYSATAVLTVYEKPEILNYTRDTVGCEQDSLYMFINPGVTSMPTYNWQYHNGATWLTVPPTPYEGYNKDTLFINGLSSAMNGMRYRVILSGYCAPDSISEEIVLTVNERPEVLGIPLDQTICEFDGTSFGISSGVTTNPIFTWEYFDGGWNTAGAGDGIFSDWDTDTIVLANVDASWNGVQFRAIVDNTECGPADTSMVATLTVKNRPMIDDQPDNATTCEYIPTLFGIDGGITSDPTYTWEVSSDDGANWTGAFGSSYGGVGTDTLHILNPTSAMHGYLYRVVLGGYCTPNDTSDVVSLTVLENPEIVLEPVNAAVCELTDTLFVIDAGVTTAPTYQWYYDDGTGMKVLPEGAPYSGTQDSALIVTAAPFTHDTYQFQAVVSGFCGTPKESGIVELTVYKEPEIVDQPVSVDTCEFSNVRFSIDVGDTEAPVIQWFEDNGTTQTALSNGGGYIGATSETLQIFGVDSSMTGYEYYASVINDCAGPLSSDPAALTVRTAPKIWVEPVDATICEGSDTSFTIEATGYNMDYVWFVDDGVTTDSIEDAGVYSGQGTPTLTISGADRSYHRYRYYVQISGTCVPMVQSDIVFLNINNPAEIVTQPINDTICEFATAKFTAEATGYDLTYQWEESTDNFATYTVLSDGGNYIGATTKSLSIFSLDRSYDGYEYRLQIMSECGSTTTDVAELTVQTPPEVITDPVDTTVCHGTPAEFEIDIVGSELRYEWYVNEKTGSFDLIDPSDTDYSGADSPILTKVNADFSTEDGYSYYVKVIGTCGDYSSDIVYMNIRELAFIDDQPADISVCEGSGAWFQVGSHVANLVYEWEISGDGVSWTKLVDDGNYSDLDTDRMSITTTDSAAMDAKLYRVALISICDTIWSDPVTLTVWGNPRPNIIGDQPKFPVICGGDVLTLDGNPSGGSSTYVSHKWSGDDLYLGNTDIQTPVFESRVKGKYNLVYTVEDNNGCIGSAAVEIDNHIPTAAYSTSYEDEACGLLTVEFYNESSDEADDFDWVFGDGFSSGSDADTVVHGFENLTGHIQYYPVVLTANEDVFGDASLVCSANSPTKYITIYPSFDPEITPDVTEGCQPLEVNMTATNGAATYNWIFGDGNGENGGFNYTSHTYLNNTSETVVYETVLQTISGIGGCKAYDTIEITVFPIPQPDFTATPWSQMIPEVGPAPVVVSNLTQTGPWTFVWDFGDGSRDTTASYSDITHNYELPGSYTIKLYSSMGECVDSTATSIQVTPRPPVASFTSITEGCHPLTVEFTNTSLYAESYVWVFGDGAISIEENPVHTYYVPGEYTVELQATGADGLKGDDSQAYTTITAHATPLVVFNSAPDSVFVNDDPVKFFNLSTWADDYLWDFGDVDELYGDISDENTSTASDPTHVYEYEGWKDVKLIGWNEHCSDSLLIIKAVKVIPAGEVRFPTVFRPGDSPYDGEVGNLSDADRNSVFFPGVSKQVNEYHLYIYNRWGEQIFQSDDINVGWDGYIKGTKAAQGVYIWKVTGLYSNGSPFSDAGDVTLIHKSAN